LKGALARARALKAKLEDRKAHSEIYKYCKAELLEENYFHAVFEAIKGVFNRIRELSGLSSDGAELINKVFSIKAPILAINALSTETEQSEQKGFSNILIVKGSSLCLTLLIFCKGVSKWKGVRSTLDSLKEYY